MENTNIKTVIQLKMECYILGSFKLRFEYRDLVTRVTKYWTAVFVGYKEEESKTWNIF